MTDLAEAADAVEVPTRFRRRRMVSILCSVVLLLAGTVAGVLITLHYRSAPPLANRGGDYGWASPDNRSTRFVDLGPYQGLVAPMRAGRRQSFYIDIENDSSVTQTVLGLKQYGDGEDQLQQVAISTGGPDSENSFDATYVRGPVDIPPHAVRFLRYTFGTPKCPPTSDQYWDGLTLRVRVGAFTRTETVNFENNIFELTAPKSTC